MITLSSIGTGKMYQKNEDDNNVRVALYLSLSQEGREVRKWMSVEIVTVVDTLSREALLELSNTLGLNTFLAHFLFCALNSELQPKTGK